MSHHTKFHFVLQGCFKTTLPCIVAYKFTHMPLTLLGCSSWHFKRQYTFSVNC